MKKTRNLFILIGATTGISKVMLELQFKGTTVIDDNISGSRPEEIFDNNKSIICSSGLSGIEGLHSTPIYIEVTNSSNHTLQDYIDTSKSDIVTQFQYIAERHNCDIGDHKSNSSGLNGVPSTKHCNYCKSFSKGTETILYKSQNFYVVATVGQFITGYLLIIPVEHIMSIAELDSSKREEFIQVLNDIKHILSLTYNCSKFLIWENGTGNLGIGKAKDSVVHAHVHIAPSTLTAESVQSIYGISLKQINTEEISNYNTHSYLLIRGNDDNTWFINDNPNLYIPRQFIRQLIAEEYGLTSNEAWNWRVHPYYALMEQTQQDIFTSLKEHWATLSYRIKANTEKYIID